MLVQLYLIIHYLSLYYFLIIILKFSIKKLATEHKGLHFNSFRCCL